MNAGKKHLFDDPRNVRRLIGILFVLSALLLAVDYFYHRHLSFEKSEVDLPQAGWFGFYALYGFVACVLLVLVAKYVLRKIVMRSEDYYER